MKQWYGDFTLPVRLVKIMSDHLLHYIYPFKRGKETESETSKMASTTTAAPVGWRAKLDNALKEKNFFTDLLQKIEEKTGVRRLYIVIGKLKIGRKRHCHT